MPEETLIYSSAEACWRCAQPLVELRPPKDGWRLYCSNCRHLTITRAECDAAWASIGSGALGTVVAVRCSLQLEPVR